MREPETEKANANDPSVGDGDGEGGAGGAKLSFDDRIRQKIAEGDNRKRGSADNTTKSKPAHVKPDDRVERKLDEARKSHTAMGGLAAAPDATDARFNDQLKRKIAEAHITNSESGGLAASSDSARDNFDDRLKRKLVEEQNTNSESGGLAAGSDSAGDKFEDRLKRKLTEERNESSKEAVGLAAASTSSDERLNDHSKQKLFEEDKPSGNGFATASNAIDKFEDRLKRKVSQEDITKRGAAGIASASNASEDKFDDRLGRKVPQEDKTKNNLVEFSAASNKAVDERLDDHLNSDGGENFESTGAATASDRFHNRLKQKLSEDDGKKGNAVDDTSSPNGAHELFEDRLRMKAMSSTEADGGAWASPNERQVTEGTGNVITNDNDCIAASVVTDRSPSLKKSTQGEYSIIDENVSDAESGIIMMERIAPSSTNQSGQSIASKESDDLGRRSVEPTGGRRSFVGRMTSTLQAQVSATGEYLVAATLVEDSEAPGEVVMAERVGVFERKGKLFAFAFCLLVAVLAVVTPLWLTGHNANGDAAVATPFPTYVPSMPPSFDPRPTLEIVQERGVLRCGIASLLGERLCQAAASVILGDPNSCEQTYVWPGFRELQERSLDVMLEVRYMVKDEVNEPITRAGFSFSVPYIYDDTFYRGNRTYVECAQNQTRHGICSTLQICFIDEFGGLSVLKSQFPPNFYVAGPTMEMIEMLRNGTCNVIAAPASGISSTMARDFLGEDMYDATIIGKDTQLPSSVYAIATRNTDREFSDVMKWIINTIIYGDERGMKDDISLCRNYTNLPKHASELNFLNAIYCVGNYSSIMTSWSYSVFATALNQVDDGSAGLLFATPFGPKDNGIDDVGAAALLNDIVEKGPLQCGVVVPDGFDGDIMTVSALVGMNVDFCRALSAALFSGNWNYVTVTGFSNKNGFVALNDGVIDVLAGAKVEKEHDFANPSTGLDGFDFSKPYFFGNESIGDDLTIHALATREDNEIFSSFVNSVVLAPINAQEKGIDGEQSNFMSLMPWFGGNFAWALRDVVRYTGSYDELYEKHFGVIPRKERGRNRLNEGGPLLYSIPGLSGEIGNGREGG